MALEEKKNGKMTGGATCTCGCGASDGSMMSGGCGCGRGGHGRHWTFFLLRTLLTVLILMIVFWFGVVAGRIGSGYYGRPMMMGGYGYGSSGMMMGAGTAMPMMRVNGATTTPSTTNGVQNY
jgi:hypothetical protein